MDIKISIIVPVYNAEKYIEFLLNSIKNQLRDDIELILIDDGSTDDSFKICSNFEQKNNNVKVITQKNQGVSAARNKGIDTSLGEYILFLDADDFLLENSLERVVKCIINDKPDICQYNFNILASENFYTHFLDSFYTENKVLSKNEFIKGVISAKGYQGFVWNKIYRREIINNTRFDNSIHYLEDTIFNVTVVNDAKKIICSRHILLNYRQHEESAVAGFTRKQLTYIDALDILERKLPEQFSNEIKGRKLLSYITFGSKLFLKDSDNFKKMKRKFKNEKRDAYLNSENYKITEKILLHTGYFKYEFAIFLFYLKDKIVKSKLYYKVRK